MNKKSHPPGKALNFLLKFMDSEEQENFSNYVDYAVSYTHLTLPTIYSV